jgi:hypothetical protein
MINRDELLKNYMTGNFLNTVYEGYGANCDDRHGFISELAALHNERSIDIVEAFESLAENPSDGPDFFLTQHIFEEVLPSINAPVLSVMQCVLRLYRSAGQDLSSDSIIDAFTTFCAKDPSRPREALKNIEANPEQLADLLPATIISGSRVDSLSYLAEAIRLCEDEDIELRRRAVFSIGEINLPACISSLDLAYTALTRSIEIETDDQILANSVRSVFKLLQQDKTQEPCASTLIESTLSKGGELTLHAASEVFGFHTAELSVPLIDLLSAHLIHVKSSNKGTLKNIDYGISHLLKEGDLEKGIGFLEDLLLEHHNELIMDIFGSTASRILSNNELISKVLTRWFLRGDRVLCNAVHKIIGTHCGDDLPLEIDPSELKPTDLVHIVFIARKAIGYLFMRPISAASILISLMRHTTEDKILTELGVLLFDPLLLNYPGTVREYVTQQSNHVSSKVKEVLDKTLKDLNDYLDNLRSVGNLVALHPSEAQREAYHRHFSYLMEESRKEAEAQSVFLNLVSKCVLLYGRKSINYVHGSDGQSHRMEMPLQNHGIEIEFPRMESLDPFGLDYTLRMFRNERIKT